jgi:hypothetical protein
MIFRGIDIDGDWNFGKGRNDYLRGKKALMVNLKTRLIGSIYSAVAISSH